MRIERCCFGSIRIDGITYEHDIVIDRGNIYKRNKKPSKPFRAALGHTPISSSSSCSSRIWLLYMEILSHCPDTAVSDGAAYIAAHIARRGRTVSG